MEDPRAALPSLSAEGQSVSTRKHYVCAVKVAAGHIAILFFSNRPHHEGRRKRWWRGHAHRRNRMLAQRLSQHTQQVIQTSGLPVFHFHEGNQRGATFGERLANAYTTLFEQGFDAVIAVGNDSPGLCTVNWTAISNALSRGQCVLGPSRNGGAYLIGLTRAAFSQFDFQGLPWQQRELFQALAAYCARTAGLQLLPPRQDINRLRDLIALLQEPGLQRSCRQWLRKLLYGSTNTPSLVVAEPCHILWVAAHSGRAPPPVPA